jgi:hypothetical protein
MATRQGTGGCNGECPCPKTLPFRSLQAIDSQVPVWADCAAQNQMFVGKLFRDLNPVKSLPAKWRNAQKVLLFVDGIFVRGPTMLTVQLPHVGEALVDSLRASPPRSPSPAR